MKKTFYSLIAIAVTLVTFTACSSDGGGNFPKPKKYNLPEKATTIVPEEVLDQIKAQNFPINEGTNPPVLNGTFVANPWKLLYTSHINSWKVGKELYNYKFTFYNQQGVNLKLDYSYQGENTDVGKGVATIISGNGNKLSIFSKSEGIESDVKYTLLSVFSGELTANGIKDLKRVLYVQSKENDPNNKLIPVGGIRIWYDSDNISPKK